MNQRDYQIAIASLISDYRKGELPFALGADHVDRWIRQFDAKDQLVILEETFHVLNRSYYKADRLNEFYDRILGCLTKADKLENYTFLCNQTVGESQERMLAGINRLAKEKYGTSIQITNQIEDMQRVCVYVDDALYTGRRIRSDMQELLASVDNKEIVIFLISAYTNNLDYCQERISQYALERNNTICWRVEKKYNNKKNIRERYDTVWPHENVLKERYIRQYGEEIAAGRKATYLTHNDAYEESLFTTEENSRIVSEAFLKKGFEILQYVRQTRFRPLGFDTNISYGFGSFLATDMNISNTCPLVLWWGTFDKTDNPMLDCWYPLLPRRGNGELSRIISEMSQEFALEDYYDVLIATHRLAEARREKERKTVSRAMLYEWDQEEFLAEREKDELLQYLYSLNLAQIKIIAAVMYIGRDLEIEPTDEFYDELADYCGEGEKPVWQPYPVNDPNRIVQEELLSLEETFGIDKSNWAEQIHQKMPLNRYLEKGFYKLGILRDEY